MGEEDFTSFPELGARACASASISFGEGGMEALPERSTTDLETLKRAVQSLPPSETQLLAHAIRS